MTPPRIILGIETSCDETAAAIIIDGKIVADRTTRQILHEHYGGVVPELASRAHEQLLAPAVESVLHECGLSVKNLDAVAVTFGPGLAGALLVGLSFAKGLSAALGIPFWAVNHIEAHLWIAQLTHGELPTPSLALVVSGGHSLLLSVDGFGRYSLIGTTRDDAVGELFDKVGRVIGFPFPAGAEIDRLAMSFRGKPVPFPVSKIKGDPFAFSFSGIKTAVINHVNNKYQKGTSNIYAIPDEERAAICAGLMQSVARSLALPISRALRDKPYESFIMAGGVSASRFLRQELGQVIETADIPFLIPPYHHCTDNGAMIAYLGYLKAAVGIPSSPMNQDVDPSAKIFRNLI